MQDWQHNIEEIRKCEKDPERYLIFGETIDNQLYTHTEWSHEVDSKGVLVSSPDESYCNTKLKECITDYLGKRGGKITLIFHSPQTDIIYHAKENGYVWME